MKHTCRMIFALCLTLQLCGPSLAQHAGPYVGAFAGGNALMSANCSGDQGNFDLRFDPGLLGSAVLGWDFVPGDLAAGEGRIELEYTRRSNPLNQARFVEGDVQGSGSVTADSLMVNFFGVFNDDRFWAPYIGTGLGAARIETSDLKVTGQSLSSDSAVVFAYQVGAGVFSVASVHGSTKPTDRPSKWITSTTVPFSVSGSVFNSSGNNSLKS